MARPQKYIVTLSATETEQLTCIAKNYRYSQRERNRAKILLLAHQGQSDLAIKEQIGCHVMTVHNIRQRYCEKTLPVDTKGNKDKGAISIPVQVKRARQANRRARVFDGEKEAQLVAIVCSTPPDGAKQWTLELLQEKVISLRIVDHVAKETIRQTLKKTNLSPGRKSAGAFLPARTLDS